MASSRMSAAFLLPGNLAPPAIFRYEVWAVDDDNRLVRLMGRPRASLHGIYDILVKSATEYVVESDGDYGGFIAVSVSQNDDVNVIGWASRTKGRGVQVVW